MFRPKRSKLKSRSQASLNRKCKFIQASFTWEGIPIMAANMDTVGTFEMALALSNAKVFTAIHKHYSIEEWTNFLNLAPAGIEEYIAVSTGTGEQDLEKVAEILNLFPKLKFICIDVANG